ncbi:hypothetical protein MKX01_035418 [Papaver californicum]|nr:hypothetical protein MKX01_035418 [Papaver californicum]
MDAVVSTLVNATVSFGVNKVKQGIGVRKKLEDLGQILMSDDIHHRLNEAHLSVVGYMRDRRYNHLSIAKNIQYDFEDLMEQYNNEFGRDRDKQRKVDWGKARLLFLPSCVTRFPLRHRMGGKISDINERIKKFKENINYMTAVPKQTERHCFSSEVGDSKILGRGKEEVELLRMLGCSDDISATDRNHEVATATIASASTSTTVQFIFVIGSSGYGKTTFVQFVIKDKKVKEHFKGNIYWVSVSGSIDDIKRLATAIIEAMEGTAPEYYEWDPLHRHLRNCIKKKETFLLVLDDCCGVDRVTWNTELKPCLDAAAPGSRILVTTQLTNLSNEMGISNKHTLPLSGLLDDDAWLLLCDTALPGRSREHIRQFETIGKELARGCQGVPFVIKNLGYALRSKETPQEWKAVLQNGIWNLNSMDGGIPNSKNEGLLPPLLFVTYDAFPQALQRCFKFCACLPYDYEITRDILIKFWMALGFLDETDGGQEEEGDRYFKTLSTCSFLHVSKPGGTHYKFYHHVYVLVQSLAGNESCYYTEIGTSSCSKICSGDDTRHATIILRDNDTDYAPGTLSQADKLRMLKLMRNGWGSLKAPSYVFYQFPYLRALDMSCTSLTELPPEVRKLRFLKILILSGSRFKKIPDTVCDLKSLQTLILNDCGELTGLPRKIGKLTMLRHLEVRNTPNLQKFPKGFGKLKNLRTLSKFVVAAPGSRKGANIGELKELNLLQGHLEIKGLNRVKSGYDAMEAALADKEHLQSMCLDFERNLSQNPETVKIMEDVLEALKPNHAMAISNVELCNYPSAHTPSWMTRTTNGE